MKSPLIFFVTSFSRTAGSELIDGVDWNIKLASEAGLSLGITVELSVLGCMVLMLLLYSKAQFIFCPPSPR